MFSRATITLGIGPHSSLVNVNGCKRAVYYMGMLYLHNDIFLTDYGRPM